MKLQSLALLLLISSLFIGYIAAQCQTDSDCTVPPLIRCRTSDGQCVECLEDEDCDDHPEGFRVCSLVTNTCVEPDIGPKCEDDADCTEEGKPRCKVDDRDSANNICVECIENSDCEGNRDTDGRTKCSAVTNTCVSETHCQTNDDCKDVDGKPYCRKQTDTALNECVECLENSHCDKGEICNGKTYTCGKAGTTAVSRLDVKFSRYPNHKKKDPRFDAIVARVVAASADNDACKIDNPAHFVTVAKRTWGYYLIGSGCTDEDAKHIQEVANKDADESDDEPSSDGTEDAKVTVNVGVTVIEKEYPETCVNYETHEVHCAAIDAENCTLPCVDGTPCTKDNAKKICGSYQECLIEDDKTTGVCNTAAYSAIMSSAIFAITLIALIFAVV